MPSLRVSVGTVMGAAFRHGVSGLLSRAYNVTETAEHSFAVRDELRVKYDPCG